MRNTDHGRSEFLGIARELLGEGGADFSSFDDTFATAQRIIRRFYDHLRPRMGDGAFRSMLQLAHRTAMTKQPVLGDFIVQSDANPFLGEATPSIEEADEATLCEGLTHLLAEFLLLMRDLGQDQDWGLVELWPGLKALHRSGVTLDPEKGEDRKSLPDTSSDPRA